MLREEYCQARLVETKPPGMFGVYVIESEGLLAYIAD